MPRPLPEAQPGRSRISCTTGDRSSVAYVWPLVQGARPDMTSVEVVDRTLDARMLDGFWVFENVPALSMSQPANLKLVSPESL